MSGERMARYFTRVHASNRHAGYGEPVEVLASSRQEAVSRAISLGWSGRRDDARVTIDKVVDEAPTHAPADEALVRPLEGVTLTPEEAALARTWYMRLPIGVTPEDVALAARLEASS